LSYCERPIFPLFSTSRLQKQGGGVNKKFLTVFFRCHICFYIKKSLIQNKEHRIFMFQGIVSDFTQKRWSKDKKIGMAVKNSHFTA
jgi:hypothetical protein